MPEERESQVHLADFPNAEDVKSGGRDGRDALAAEKMPFLASAVGRVGGAADVGGSLTLALLVCVLPACSESGDLAALIAGGGSNAAAAANGGFAAAVFSQETFHPSLAIDGRLESRRGWAFHGRLRLASILFGFQCAHDIKRESRVHDHDHRSLKKALARPLSLAVGGDTHARRVRLMSGLGFEDHRITSFELWAWDAETDPAEPNSECVGPAFRTRLEEASEDRRAMQVLAGERNWRRLVNVKVLGEGASADRGVLKTGDGRLEVAMEEACLSGLKVVVLSTDTETNNGVLTELEAFGTKSAPSRSRSVDDRPVRELASEGVDTGPTLAVVSPRDGTTTDRGTLEYRLKGAELGADGSRIEVSMDGEAIAVISEELKVPLILDRDRRERPTGLTWHTVTLNMLDASGQQTGVSATSRFRLVGPKFVVPGPGQRLDIGEAGIQLQKSRADFPQAYPRVCASFLSCGRVHLLRHTMRSFIRHMEAHEQHIPYEIAWIDQGSGKPALEFLASSEVEHALMWQLNYGVTFGINTLLFDLCRRSRFVMTLEEDWLWLKDKDQIPAVGMAIQVLEHDSEVVGVFLRSVVQFGRETSVPGNWTATHGGVSYRRMCQKDGVWGSWTNGAAIWDRERLGSRIGRMNEGWGDAAEQEYATRVGKIFCAAQLFVAGCEDSACSAVFEHVGDERSPDWDPEIEYLGQNSFTCTSYGKSLHGGKCQTVLERGGSASTDQ